MNTLMMWVNDKDGSMARLIAGRRLIDPRERFFCGQACYGVPMDAGSRLFVGTLDAGACDAS